MPDKLDQIVEDLEDIFERERAYIMAGNLEALGRLLPEKERLIGQFDTIAADESALIHIQKKAARNQLLLAAAARGIRSALNRLDALKSSELGLRTYTQAGQSKELARTRSNLERKA